MGVDITRNILREIADEKYLEVNPLLLPDSLKIAFLGRVLQSAGDVLPVDFRERMIEAIAAALNQLNPQLLMCGEVKPVLFGIPLAPDFVSAKYQLNKNGRAGEVGFSPSMLLALLLDPRMFPPVDSAKLGYREVFPEFDNIIIAGLRGDFFSPDRAAALVRSQFESLFRNSTMTATYELAPAGFELANAAARVIIPDFVRHPLIRPGGWQRPEEIGLPSRTNMLQAMLRADVLGNPLWAGNNVDLALLYPGDTNAAIRTALSTRTLQRDYFPHGGIVGAGFIDVPRAIYEAPPEELHTLLNPNTNAIARLLAGLSYVNNYVLKTTKSRSRNRRPVSGRRNGEPPGNRKH